MRLGVLVSGRGSNLEAILDAGLSVALVVCNRPGVRALEVAAAHDVTPAQIALAWTVHHPHVVAIPGASSVAQVESNAAHHRQHECNRQR